MESRIIDQLKEELKLDEEWVDLILTALQSGVSPESIRVFFLKKTK